MLEIRDLSVNYGPVNAVSHVSLEITAGNIVALVGANGAGKSSLLAALSGLVPFSGEVKFEGCSLPREPHKIVKKGIVQIPEGRQIFSNLTVYENLLCGAYTLWQQEHMRKNVERVYSLFPLLQERCSQYAGTLSGGQRQMLALGRGLMSNPQVLLIDEPSLGLAPLLVQQVIEMITQINKQGVTILLVEQNARKSLGIADYAYVMQNGRIVHQGTGKELMIDPAIHQAYLGGRH